MVHRLDRSTSSDGQEPRMHQTESGEMVGKPCYQTLTWPPNHLTTLYKKYEKARKDRKLRWPDQPGRPTGIQNQSEFGCMAPNWQISPPVTWLWNHCDLLRGHLQQEIHVELRKKIISQTLLFAIRIYNFRHVVRAKPTNGWPAEQYSIDLNS